MNRVAPVYDCAFYHVFNRGNRKQTIFGDRSDYLSFIRMLKIGCERYKVRVDAFCLMPNHFHLLALQLFEGSLPRFTDSVQTSAAKRYNLKYGEVGHLFQGRYKYKPADSNESVLNVARYIHLNPVEARLVSRPEDWPHSNFKDLALRAGIEGKSQTIPPIDFRKSPPPFPSTARDYVESVRLFMDKPD